MKLDNSFFKNSQKKSSIQKNKDCKCTYTYCERHGICGECQKYHREDGSKTGCGK